MRVAVFRTCGLIGFGAGLLAGAAGLSGCADIRRATSLPPVNPESPVASEVAVGARRNFPTPGFSNVPPAPKDVPPAAAVKTAVFMMVGCRRTFERYDLAHPQPVSDTVEFAKAEAAKTDLNPADVPTVADDKASLVYAESLRAYAAPPPALDSGPAPTAAQATPPPMPSPPPVAKSVAKPVAAKAAVKAVPVKTAKAKPTAPKPAARPAKVAAAPPAVPPAATPEPPPAPVKTEALAIAPPPPAALGDPLLSHCR